MAISLRPHNLARYRDLARLLIKYGRSDLVKQAGLDEVLEAGTNGSAPEVSAKAEELADDLERLGPTYIKLGQLLSTRGDLIPPSYAQALSRLQDSVEPISFEEVERVVSTELGVRISKGFASFESEPLASASLGQVHRAEMRDGRQVVVKVQRPGIRDCIAADMEALAELAEFADEHTEAGRQYGFAELLEQFRRSLYAELDYRREAANLRELRRILKPYDRLVVPAPIDDYTSGTVLTMEYVPGRKVTDLGPLARLELEGRELADQLFKAYLDQILVEGFFHADPHPGNVLLTDDGRLALIDVGMVARVSKPMRSQLVKLLLALSEGNGRAAADATVTIGRPLESFDGEGFCSAASELVERSHGLSLDQLDAGSMVMELMRISGENGLRLPPELSMLGKALLNLDQVAHTLDPEFDPVAAINEHSNTIMQAQMSTSSDSAFSTLLEARDFIEQLPGRVNKVMDTVAEGNFRLKVDALDERELMRGFEKLANRLTMGLVLAALIVGAAMLMRVPTSSRLMGYPTVAIVCFLAAAAGGFALLFAIFRSDRRGSSEKRRRG
ncbi:MAG TPA: AarF/UbiB family protein [Acidimicrobiales bacterium]|nr:AarF/UbiB family protein [Acidimicrobiales bacterium]